MAAALHRVALVVTTALLLVAGCTRTFSQAVTQPNPLVEPSESLMESEPVTIVTGDMDLNQQPVAGVSGQTVWVPRRYPLRNVARFTVVSRDRLRFHIQLEHKWEEYADLGTWRAYLQDDRGRRYVPEAIEPGSDRVVVKMWDYEVRSVSRTVESVNGDTGDITAIHDDGHLHRTPLATMALFRGKGDIVFHRRDLFTSQVKSLTLHIERSGTAFEFTWRFFDAPGEVGATAGTAGAVVSR